MKKIVFRFICLLFLLNIIFIPKIFATEVPDIVCPYAGVYRMDNLELLYGKSEDTVIPIASITKLMTAIVALENIPNLNDKVRIDYDKVSQYIDSDYAVAGIDESDTLTYYDLVATMLIPSGADSAVQLGLSVFDSMDTFVAKMNEKAQELGMTNSHFANVIGIDDEQNYSTINDVAKMLKYALENSIIKELISTYSYTTTDEKVTVRNAMNVIADARKIELKYTLGGKTGSTGDAGLCLASYAIDEGNTILCITAGVDMYSYVPYNIIDTEKLYEYIATNYSMQEIASAGDFVVDIPAEYCEEEKVSISLNESVEYYIDSMDKSKVKLVYTGKNKVDSTMNEYTKLGSVKVYYDDVLVKTVDVFLNQKLKFDVVGWLKDNGVGLLIMIIVIDIILIILRRRYIKAHRTVYLKGIKS